MHTHLPLIKRLGLSREIRAAALAFCAVFVTGIYGRAASVSEPFSYTITATGSQSVVSYPAQAFAYTVTGTGTESWSETVVTNQIKSYLVQNSTWSAVEYFPFMPTLTGKASVSYNLKGKVGNIYGVRGVASVISLQTDGTIFWSDSTVGMNDWKSGSHTFDVLNGKSYTLILSTSGNRGEGYAGASLRLPAQVTVTLTAKRTGQDTRSATVSATEGDKEVGPVSVGAYPKAQQGGYISGVTYTIEDNNANVITRIQNQTVFANTSYAETNQTPWSATESGQGSVALEEGLKFIAVSTLVAPNGDTRWSVSNDHTTVQTTMEGNKLYAQLRASPLQVTVQSSPQGRSFTVDGTPYTSAQTFTWISGSSHAIAAAAASSGGTGIQYAWDSWSDGGALAHTISPVSNTTYTARFTTQYYLTVNAGNGGGVAPAGGWYQSGAPVALNATPNAGFAFGGWTGTGSGSYSGTNRSASVTMNGPLVQTANFTPLAGGIRGVDFNGDGRVDLVWRRKDGALAIWGSLGGLQYLAYNPSPASLSDTNWMIVGTADFNGDGQTDILWQHTDGWVSVWLMKGSQLDQAVRLNPGRVADAAWRMVGTGDFNGDGQTDLLWQHPDGWLAIWLMRGTTLLQAINPNPGRVTDTAWRVAGAADFNGDGQTDILWRRADGWLAIWLMNGATLRKGVNPDPARLADTQWQIMGTGDFNGDGQTDILWQHDEGWVAFWLMQGTQLLEAARPNPGRVTDLEWRLVGPK